MQRKAGRQESPHHLLSQKQTLADGVLDGTEDFAAIRMPNGRAAIIERMQALLGHGTGALPRILSPEEALVEDMKARHGDRLMLAEIWGGRLITVLDADRKAIAAERRQLGEQSRNALPDEVIEASAWEMLRRLSEAGVLEFTSGAPRILHQAAPPASEALLAAE